MLKVMQNLYNAAHIYIACAALSLLSTLFIGNNLVFADNVDYTVNVAPSLNISLSGDILDNSVVLNLNPNNKTSDSKSITVKVGTNNITGYKLTMANTNNTTDLVRDNTDNLGNATIPTLTTTAGTTPESLETNTWGYKKDSGNFIPFVNNTKLLENTAATNDDSTTLTFASKIDYNQIAGRYAATLAFVGVTNPLIFDMQNLNPAYCKTDRPTTVTDIRDGQEYTIMRLKDGNCWMIDNLNLGAVALNVSQLDSSNTHLTGQYASRTISASAFSGWKKTSVDAPYTIPALMSVSGTDSVSKTPYGSVYCYCAVSVQTICSQTNSSNSYDADLCPAGWRLPYGGSNGDFYNLSTEYNSYDKMRAPISEGGAAFSMPGSFFSGGLINVGSYGSYWSSTSKGSTYYMSGLYLSGDVDPNNDLNRAAGRSIRCILSES